MCLIGVPNLKEMHIGEGCFFSGSKLLFKIGAKKKKTTKKIGQFLETHISKTTWLIFIKFGMPSHVYGGH